MVMALVVDLRKLDWSQATTLKSDFRRNVEEGTTNDLIRNNTALRVTSPDGKSYPIVTSHDGDIDDLVFPADRIFVRHETVANDNGQKLSTPIVEYAVYTLEMGIGLTSLKMVTSLDQIAAVVLTPQDVPHISVRPKTTHFVVGEDKYDWV